MANTIEKISRYAEKGKVMKILPYTRTKDKETRLAAIRALGRCDDEESIHYLTGKLTSCADKDELFAVLDALGSLGKDQSFYHIGYYIDKVNDPEVVRAMRLAMARIRERRE